MDYRGLTRHQQLFFFFTFLLFGWDFSVHADRGCPRWWVWRAGPSPHPCRPPPRAPCRPSPRTSPAPAVPLPPAVGPRPPFDAPAPNPPLKRPATAHAAPTANLDLHDPDLVFTKPPLFIAPNARTHLEKSLSIILIDCSLKWPH